MSDTSASGSPAQLPNDSGEFNDLLDQLVAVRGVEAAAIVGIDGEFLQGRAADDALLQRMVGTVTSAMAAGEALAGLLESPTAPSRAAAAQAEHGAADSGGPELLGGPDDGGVTAAAEAGGVAEAHDSGSAQHQLMVMYQDGGPILFTPLANGECVAVVALSSSHDIGRLRFRLRGLASTGGRL